MNQRKIGRTGLPVSELCLGAMQFGWLTDEKNSHAILDAYCALADNFIQTTAGGPATRAPGLCRSEEITGAWLQADPPCRDRAVAGLSRPGTGAGGCRGHRTDADRRAPRPLEAAVRRQPGVIEHSLAEQTNA
jgi:hypothetical protein